MPITINGAGTVTGITAGGLPDDCITTAEIAAHAVTYAKIGTTEQGQLCKAWVNFNGTGTVAIRASYNVSSIADTGTGLYTVNFTTAMVDANYAAVTTCTQTDATSTNRAVGLASDTAPQTTTTVSLRCENSLGANSDLEVFTVAIFR